MVDSFQLANTTFGLNPLSTDGFPQRWYCGEWPEWLGWTHIISDLTIFVSYQLIPVFAIIYLRKKKNISFTPLLLLFGAFICLCGLGHLIEAIIFWHPIYPLAGLVKVMTALVSGITAFYCFRLMPKALNLPTIAESEARHRTLFNAIPLCVMEVDFEGNVLMMNKETEKVFKYTQSQLIGKNIDILVPDRFKKEHQKHFDLYCENPVDLKLQDRELLAKTKDGKEFHVEIAISPSPDRKSLICSIIDVDERVRNQQKLDSKNNEMRSLFSFGLLGFAKTKLDGEILEVNDYFLSLIGYSRKDLESKGIWWNEITPANVLEKELKLLEKIKEKKKVGPYEKQYIHRDGHVVDTLIGISLIAEDEGICSCCILDISEIKNKERELQKASKLLQKALDEQIESKEQIQKYVEELKYINKELDDFVYTASHDLKEPLRAIGGLTSLLLHKSKESLDEEETKLLLDDVVNLSKRARDQIDSLLSYSLMGKHQIKIKEFNPKELVMEVVNSFEFQINERNAEITIENNFPDLISADKSMVTKVFENLLSNALKHTGQDPKIRIGTELRENVNYFYVQDNGEGIKKEDQEFIFKIFKTLKPGAGNTGAGLAIVKKIINSHKGRILVDSEPGQGTKILFSIEAGI